MNLVTMRDKLRVRIGNLSTTDVPDANLTGHINGAYSEITDKYAFHCTRERKKFSTTAGIDKYVLPTAHTVLNIWDRTNRLRLEKVGSRYVADNEFDGTAAETRGKPTHYARFEEYIQLLPIPDGVYVMEVFFKEAVTDLAADGDVPVIPLPWHRGILLLATYYYFSDEGKDAQKAALAYNEYGAWLRDKPVEVHEESAVIDSGVVLPTLGGTSTRRLDFDHSS